VSYGKGTSDAGGVTSGGLKSPFKDGRGVGSVRGEGDDPL
jgi:hypothetical protein